MKTEFQKKGDLYPMWMQLCTHAHFKGVKVMLIKLLQNKHQRINHPHVKGSLH